MAKQPKSSANTSWPRGVAEPSFLPDIVTQDMLYRKGNPATGREGISDLTRGALDPLQGVKSLGVSGGGVKLATDPTIQAAVEADRAKQAEIDDFLRMASYEGAAKDPRLQLQAELLGDSQAAKAAADPAAMAAQQEALDRMLGIARGEGFTAQEEARRLQQRADSDQWLRGQREADLQNMAERGMGGSGSELAMLAADRQAQAGRNSLSDAQAAAAREQRSLDAMMSAGRLGGEMGQAAFDRSYKTGAAQDQVSQLNNQLVNDANMYNTEFLRNLGDEYRKRQYEWDAESRRMGLDAASTVMGTDQADSQAGATWASNLGKTAADQFNAAQDAYRNASMQAATGGALGKQSAGDTADAANREATAQAGKAVVDTVGTIAGLAGGGNAGAGAAVAGSSGGDGLQGFSSGITDQQLYDAAGTSKWDDDEEEKKR